MIAHRVAYYSIDSISSGLWSKAGHDDHDFSCPFLMVFFFFFFFVLCFFSLMLVVFSGVSAFLLAVVIYRSLPSFHWFGTLFFLFFYFSFPAPAILVVTSNGVNISASWI